MTHSRGASATRPRSIRSESSERTTCAFSVLPSRMPRTCFLPCESKPKATSTTQFAEVDAVDHHHRQRHLDPARQPPLELPGAQCHEAARDRALGHQRFVLIDRQHVQGRAIAPTGHPRGNRGQRRRVQRVAVARPRVGRKARFAGLEVSRTRPRDRDLPTAQGDPASGVAAAVGAALRVGHALRTAQRRALRFHHRPEHRFPCADAQADECALDVLQHARDWQRDLGRGPLQGEFRQLRLRERLHFGGSFFCFGERLHITCRRKEPPPYLIRSTSPGTSPNKLPRSIRGLWKADLFLGNSDVDAWVATTIKINPVQLQAAQGLRIGVYPKQNAKDLPGKDESLNLIRVPLPYDGQFMEVFYESFFLVRAFLRSDATVPKPVDLPDARIGLSASNSRSAETFRFSTWSVQCHGWPSPISFSLRR